MTYSGKKNPFVVFLQYLFSIILIFAILALFAYGVDQVNASNAQKQLQILDRAVSKSITECYALEGTYPPNITYLKDHYGLTYDEKNYRIDYTYIGANLRPNYMILEKKGD